MRFIILKSDDFQMFHQDIDCFEYEFYYRHKETFRRMYIEQGKDFWVRFMLSFRSAQSYDVLHMLKGESKDISDFYDFFFINVHEEFIDGPFARAKQFFDDIVTVVQDKGYLSLLQSSSVAKNPFHRKDTKDIYKRFFGNPIEKSSYLKVFLLLPLYRRLAGSLCACLRRWLDAPELTDSADISYWVLPPPELADKLKEFLQIDWTKLYDVKKHRDDILKVKITDEAVAIESVTCKKEDHRSKEKQKKVSKDGDKHPDFAGWSGKFTAENKLLSSEMLQQMSSLFELSNTYVALNVANPDLDDLLAKFPKKQDKCQKCLEANGCEDGLPPKAAAAAETRLAVSSSVGGSADSDRTVMVQSLQNMVTLGHLDFLGIQVKLGSNVAGKSKTEVQASAAKRESGMKQTGIVQSGGIEKTRSQEPREQKKKSLKKSKGKEEPNVKAISKATGSKVIKEHDDKMEFKATEESDSSRELKVFEESDSKKEVRTTEESDSEKEVKATEEPDSRKKVKVTRESDSRAEVKAMLESAYKKVKAMVESDAKQELKATKESDLQKESQATKDESDEKIGTEEEKEMSRPGSKNVRTCMNCGLQEPAPKVFKKCKRCKDEGCQDPPYYCGRSCQVLDWTARHRQEHEKSCA